MIRQQLEVDQHFSMVDDVLETLIVTRKAGRPSESYGCGAAARYHNSILSKT
jgi:hypothetical protein